MCLCVSLCLFWYVCQSECLCVCVFRYVCQSECLCVSMYVCLSVWLWSVCLCLCVSLCVSLCLCLSMCLCVSLCLFWYVCQSECLCVGVYVCLSIWQSSVCLGASLSIYLSVYSKTDFQKGIKYIALDLMSVSKRFFKVPNIVKSSQNMSKYLHECLTRKTKIFTSDHVFKNTKLLRRKCTKFV